MKRLTTMSHARYTELINGSLEKYRGRNPKTKKERVEERQIWAIRVILELPDNDPNFVKVKSGKWEELSICKDDEEKLFLELIYKNPFLKIGLRK